VHINPVETFNTLYRERSSSAARQGPTKGEKA
jgi:hypothetical protein